MTAMDERTKNALRRAILAWDRRCEAQDRRAGRAPNPYRIWIALRGIERAEELMAQSASLREALLCTFNDRLLSRVLKAVGEPDFTRQEQRAADAAWARSMAGERGL